MGGRVDVEAEREEGSAEIGGGAEYSVRRVCVKRESEELEGEVGQRVSVRERMESAAKGCARVCRGGSVMG